MRLLKLDPRTKLIMVFSLSTLAVFVRDIYLLFLVLLVSLITSYIFAGNFSFIKKMKKFIILFVGIAIIQSIFSPAGEVLFSVGSYTILTTGGLYKGIRVILRMLIIIVSATIMSSSSSRGIIQGLIQFKVPYEIAFMVSLAIRFLPVLGQEAKDAYTAIQLRGIEIEKLSFTRRLKIYSFLLMPVLTGVFFRARELSTSIEMRAFRAYPERTSYIKLVLKKRDFIVIGASFLFVSVIIYIYLI